MIAASTKKEGPYYVQTFWSPDRKHLVTAHATPGGIITLQDDNGREWEATGPQRDMNADARPICPHCGLINGFHQNWCSHLKGKL